MAINKVIIYTAEQGSVCVTHPSRTCIDFMRNGGRWENAGRGFLECQLERNVTAGHPEFAARRFIDALAFGGCTTAEALEIIRDRDCHAGSGHETIDERELPDRWFRDAWRRSHNGGPICIDIDIARKIQFARLRHFGRMITGKMQDDLLFSACFEEEIQWHKVRDAILKADSCDQLRAIWPGHCYSIFPKWIERAMEKRYDAIGHPM